MTLFLVCVGVTVACLIIFAVVDFVYDGKLAKSRKANAELVLKEIERMDLRVRPLGFKVDGSRSDS